jgi:uncharacterized protein (UPF0248 family)
MIPIHALLDRIRWDPAFGRGDFVVGYYDRVRRGIVSVPLARIQFDPGNRFSFTAFDPDGTAHDVPLHRVREVRRDGELIWRRPVPQGRAGDARS